MKVNGVEGTWGYQLRFVVVQGFQRNLFNVLLPCLNGCCPVLVHGTGADWWAVSAAASLRLIWLISFDRSLQDSNLLSRLFMCVYARMTRRVCVLQQFRHRYGRGRRDIDGASITTEASLFPFFWLIQKGGKNEIMSLDSIRLCSLWIHTNSPAELERGGNLHLSKRSLLFPSELLCDGLMTKWTRQERQHRSKRCREAS